MKKIRTSVLALVTALACVGSAFAITPSQLTASVIQGGSWFAFGGENFKDILNDGKSPLAIILSAQMPEEKKAAVTKTVGAWISG